MEEHERHSERLFGGLILVLAVLSATGPYLPQGELAVPGAWSCPPPAG